MPTPYLEPGACRGLRARASLRILRLAGWRVVLALPVPMRCVVIFYPHTSNWDFLIGLLAKWATGIFFRFVGKDTLFKGPLGAVFGRWGGIPVNRRERTGFIGQMLAEFPRHDDFRLVIAPEGTRRRTEVWRSGFYHLARAANVSLALGFIDYPKREVGVGGVIELTGDVAVDMARIAAFYADKCGRRPENQGPVKLRDDVH
ncbi:MAG: lysophospholipid acyltransferase family protein [Betaproteobacteria bacterium]